jgi:hypothetical protein
MVWPLPDYGRLDTADSRNPVLKESGDKSLFPTCKLFLVGLRLLV